MHSLAGTLAAPFPYFGGKALACETVWAAFGEVENYVEPFAGSAAMLLGAPDGNSASETIWCSPSCLATVPVIADLFADAA